MRYKVSRLFIEKYGSGFITKYFEKSSDISKKRRNEFLTDLMKIGYDIKYREYLKKYDCELDEFGILIDRDTMTHPDNVFQLGAVGYFG